MSKYNEEVLCFPASLLALHPDNPLIETNPVLINQYTKNILNPKSLQYIDRNLAETDESFKQIIPYCVLRHKDTVFSYVRTKKAGETRLHDKRSIGIGGHINPIDSYTLEDRFNYFTAMHRELKEEIKVSNPIHESILRAENTIKALIYDPTTPVGRVHFGIVHFIEFNQKPDVICNEDALTDGAFRPIMELKRAEHEFESWSQFILKKVL